MRTILAVPVLLSFTTFGCAPPPAGVTAPDGTRLMRGVRARVVPGETPSYQANASHGVHSAAQTPKLKYYGGPVLASVEVNTIYWNKKVANQSALDSFYKDIVDSGYFDWLKEYDTASQSIGRGSFGSSYVDPSAPSGNVTNQQIGDEVLKLIKSGKLTRNDDSVFMVHMPPGVKVTMDDGSTSCNQFCAYHFTTTDEDGNMVYYGVIPDQGGACSQGCGDDPSAFNNLTSVASHELIEAVTDPGIGLATTDGPPIGWYDLNFGEIGDICNADQATIAGHVVQSEWSNAKKKCIAQ